MNTLSRMFYRSARNEADMENTNDYIKTLFQQDIKVTQLKGITNDIVIHLKKGKDECYNLVRDTLTKSVNGSCIYGVDGDTVYFTINKKDALVVEKIAKRLRKKKLIEIDGVDFNPRKFG